MNIETGEVIDRTRDILRDSIFELVKQYVESGLIEISKPDVYSWQINNDRQRLVNLVEEAVNNIQRKVEVH